MLKPRKSHDSSPRSSLLLRVLQSPSEYCVDVVDTARLHVAALTDTSIANERILACAMPFAWPPVVEIIKKLRPALAAKVPQAEDKGEDKSIIDTALAEKILKEKYGKTWTTLEESLEANLKGL